MVGALAATATSALLLSALAGPAQAAPSSGSPANPSTYSAGRYIVQLAGAPVAGYQGGVSGLRATKPAAGSKLAVASADATAYRSYLVKRQDDAARTAGVKVERRYTNALNGFAANLTGDQAATLARTPGVLAVSKDVRREIDTTYSPKFLGLSAPGGLWSQLGGTNPVTGAGSGVVVGVIDTGIWPEATAFAGPPVAVAADGHVQGIHGWNGVCQTGTDFTTADCNKKLIGARYYVTGFGAGNISPEEYLSPRDGDGHGSHTSSTAAGNAGQKVVIDGEKMGTASGMAPAAKVAMYKVCWEGKEGVDAGCFDSDSVAAIDDAVADGVDVLNFSISGTSSNFLDPVEVAFLFAADAGVFVSASAGNSGPTASTVNHPSPWLTTVAASTDAVHESTVLLGNGAKYIGASITGGLSATPAVLAASAALSTADPDEARLCYPDTLDPAKATGKVVVCDRGVVARIDKSFEVQRAGGVGMVLVNTSPNSLNADFHPIPTVHLDDVAGAAVRSYVGSAASPTVAILAGVHVGSTTKVPEVATFSSRGPSYGAGGDVLKPDVSAPGVDIVAAVAPPTNYGRSWDYYSGTSMAAPHIAGIAALLKEAHPKWSPMAIKSALMTTARDHATSKDPFAQGAGFVVPNRAVDPGLVFDSGWDQWMAFLQGQGVDTGATPIDASDMNVASIAIGDLAGSQTVTRTVTNVGGRAETYRVSASLPGLKVRVSPATFTIPRGGTRTLTITITRTSAAIGQYSTGFLKITSSKHCVRVPLAVQPVSVAAPAEVHGTGASGSAPVSVKSGFTGTLHSRILGLAAGTVTDGSVALGAQVAHGVTVPAGTTLSRFDLNAANDAADLDLYLYQGTTLMAYSATGSADEQITEFGLAAGAYTLVVDGFGTGGADTADYQLTEYEVGSTAVGNATVSPASTAVSIGSAAPFTVAWSGLDPAKRYLGWVGWSDGSADVGATVVSVN